MTDNNTPVSPGNDRNGVPLYVGDRVTHEVVGGPGVITCYNGTDGNEWQVQWENDRYNGPLGSHSNNLTLVKPTDGDRVWIWNPNRSNRSYNGWATVSRTYETHFSFRMESPIGSGNGNRSFDRVQSIGEHPVGWCWTRLTITVPTTEERTSNGLPAPGSLVRLLGGQDGIAIGRGRNDVFTVVEYDDGHRCHMPPGPGASRDTVFWVTRENQDPRRTDPMYVFRTEWELVRGPEVLSIIDEREEAVPAVPTNNPELEEFKGKLTQMVLEWQDDTGSCDDVWRLWLTPRLGLEKPVVERRYTVELIVRGNSIPPTVRRLQRDIGNPDLQVVDVVEVDSELLQ